MDWFLYDNGLRLERLNILHQNLFSFLSLSFITLLILKFIQWLYAFVQRTSKILIRSNVLLLKVYSFKIFLLRSYYQ